MEFELRWREGAVHGRTGADERARADRSESTGLLFDLLDDTRVWRERLVEEAVFAAASHVRVSSAFQIDLPPELIAVHFATPSPERANVLLPLTTRRKGTLFNLDLRGAHDAPVHLLARASVAGLEALYLRQLVETGPAADAISPLLSEAMLEAICVHTPALYRHLFLARCHQWHDAALFQYLRDGLGIDGELSPRYVRPWRERCAEAGRILARRLDEPPDLLSAAEQFLLALPRVEPRPATPADIEALVEAYCNAVRAADEADDDALLVTLADYGRRFEVIVETEIPLGEPCTVKLVEDRPLKISRLCRTRQPFLLGDARSAHFEARVEDPSVVIARGFGVRSSRGHPVGHGNREEIRWSPESLSVYSSDPDRPYYVEVVVRLRLAWHLYVITLVLAMLNVAALLAALALEGGASYAEQLAVLTLPTTLAAAFVLIREQTGLASRLQALPRTVLGVALVGLTLTAGIELLRHDDPGDASIPAHASRHR